MSTHSEQEMQSDGQDAAAPALPVQSMGDEYAEDGDDAGDEASTLQPASLHWEEHQAGQDQQAGLEQPVPSGSNRYSVKHVPDVLSCAGMVVRNRGTLAAAAHERQQQQLTQQEQLVQEWRVFTCRQAARHVPAPLSASRRVLQESVCYRLRVLHVDNLPPPHLSSGVQFGLQLGVSLFDSAAGAYFGSTCYSLVEPLQGQQQQEAGAAAAVASEPSVDFSFDVFFHTDIGDASCMAVVELILVELEEGGSCSTRFSAGWTQLPLFVGKAKGLLNKQLVGGQTPASAPVMCGTPRYLQLRAVCGDQLPPPAVLGGCMVAYQVEEYPAMNPARPLLPQDFLVSHTDLIPGLRRFDLVGQPTTALHSSLNTLASPLLAAPAAVSLEGVQLVVPQLLHNLLSVLPELLGGVPPPELAALLSVPCHVDAVVYSMRLRVHNGRQFVGPWAAAQLQVQPHLGSLMLSPAPGQGLDLTWLPQDRLVVLVLEMLAAPTAASSAAGADSTASAGTVLVGRAVLAPFTDIAVDGHSAVLAEGRHKLCFDSSSCMGPFSSSSCWAPQGCSTSMLASGSAGEASGDLLLPLKWRAMLADTAARSVPDPTVQLDLQQCTRAQAQLPEAASKSAAASALAAVVTARAAPAPGAPAVVPVSDQQAAAVLSALSPPAEVAVKAGPAALLPSRSPEVEKETAPEASDSPAARSLKLAAQHLEQAANIPVQTPSATTCGGRQWTGQEAGESPADTASRQQLKQLAEAMQQQLDMLAQAVTELRQERQTLRSSLTLLESAAAPATQHTDRAQQQHTEQRDMPTQQQMVQHASAVKGGAAAADMAWVAAVPEAPQGDLAGFSGQVLQEQYQGLAPSRAVLQQLHEAGMTSALPADIQARLQAQSALSNLALQQRPQQPSRQRHTSRMAALMLEVEARDPRTTSDVVLQLLALRPAAAGPGAVALQLPSGLGSVYFTLQFYKSGPVVTRTCLLAASASGNGQQEQQLQQTQRQQPLQGGYAAGWGAAGAASGSTQGPGTLMLVPSQQQGAGPGSASAAGLVLKFQVDGSRPSELLPGQDPAQSAAEAHMAFCKYLVNHQLAVDVWDGDSLLQLGSCTTDLAGLLRQGRDLSDLLLELPLLKPFSEAGTTAAPAAGQAVGQQQLGTLVLRLINVGREPSNIASSAGGDAAAASQAPGTPAKKVYLRAAPLQPGSPVAKELRGSGSPFAVNWQHSSGGGTSGPGMDDGVDVSASTEAAATAADIIGFEQRKLAREQRLRELTHSPNSSPKHSTPGALQSQWRSSPGQHSPAGKLTATWSHPSPTKGQQQQQQQQWRPGSPLSTLVAEEGGASGDEGEPFKALQQQLLSDVDAVRKRQKPEFIRSQLRKSLVTHCTIRPSPGQALLLEHSLTNTIGRDAVFEVRVSHPQELVALESLQELRDLQQAAGNAINTTAGTGAGLPGSKALGAAAPLKLRQLVQQAVVAGGAAAAAAGGRQLVSRGRIFLQANESVSMPFRFTLQSPETTIATMPGGSSGGGSRHPQQQQHQQPQPHSVVVEFVPLGLAWPVSILELAVHPEPAVVDRTLRYSCPERELLHVEVPLGQLPGVSTELLAAAAAGKLLIASSRADVVVSVRARAQEPAAGLATGFACQQTPSQHQQQGSSGEVQQQQQQQHVCLRCKCGAAHEALQFYVWLYGDAATAQPLEAWQVFVHPLQRVDMRATVGQQSSTTLAIAGGSADRLVAAYSSQPGELQATPAMLSLPAGGITALGLVFRPRSQGQQRVRVHLVDVNTRQLVHGLLICTDAHLPPLHTQMEVTVHAGGVSQHQLEVSNTTRQDATYTTSTNAPWLLSVSPSDPQLVRAGTKRALTLVCDARALAPGATECGLVFISDAQSSLQHEECVVVTVHAV